jgi:hypothetical protein
MKEGTGQSGRQAGRGQGKGERKVKTGDITGK